MHYFFQIPSVPNRRLNPNNAYKNDQANYRVQAEAKKIVKNHALFAPQFPESGPVEIDWHIFWHKGGKRWDNDNLIAALKYHQDEVARAIGINDNRITSRVHQHRDLNERGFMLCLVSANEKE